MSKILIIEDEQAIAELLKYTLEKEGFEVSYALTGKDGLLAVQDLEPNLIILDIMLPDADGLSLCRRITLSDNIPIIMLTAKADQSDKLLGLEYGADDYITKPFDAREVVLRVKSILRRIDKAKKNEGSKNHLAARDISMDLVRHIVMKKDRLIDLTPKEFMLLETLMRNKGKVMSRADLLAQVWDFEYAGDTRTVDIHVQRIRKKLEDENAIATVFGIGYKISEEGFETQN
ncbi:MAG: response regulator transcription factor [Clostridiales bacterium]|nr:response regulator transcription factor [Clostridiales bacterium]